MNLKKQEIVMSILDTDIYEIDTVNALVYSIRKRGKSLLKANKLPSDYQQITIFKGRYTGIKATIYLHELIYISLHGIYDETMQIDHNDRNRLNNSGYNLMLRTPKDNIANSERGQYPTVLKLIRSPEIAKIRQLHSLGNSQQSIAKQLGLERLSVRYIIKRIEAGFPLKYE